MCWNYRGYARSKGPTCRKSTTPDNIREDAEAVLRFCQNELGLKGKIGVYGRSLGGVATTHLAQYVDMVIVDRSFSNLYDMAYHKFYGYMAVLLFKLGFLGKDSNNDTRFVTNGLNRENGPMDSKKLESTCSRDIMQENQIRPESGKSNDSENQIAKK